MFLKRKQSVKVKAKECAKGRYCREYNHKMESSSHLVPSCTHVVSCVMNAMNYNYKLRSVIGREDNYTINKWTWFDTQVCTTFWWSWMIARALVDYNNMGKLLVTYWIIYRHHVCQ